MRPYTHIAFADESNWIQGRFRSIALITAPADAARVLHEDLEGLRNQYGTSEFKWRGVKRRHGLALSDLFFKHCGRMRADVIIWDLEDSRHKGVQRRDDISNFERMYFHLLHNVLKYRWPDGSSWLICPDSNKDVDWHTLQQCLGWKSFARELNLFSQCGEIQEPWEFFNIKEVRPAPSEEYLVIQLADLFAGLGAYSYIAFEKYQQWKISQDNAPFLFDEANSGIKKIPLSSSDKERLPILDYVREQAERRSWQVSLDSSGGLCTKNPANPLNFWPYVPQRAQDKAPTWLPK